MATTHGLAGAALALPMLVLAPELAPVAAVAGIAGGLAPDLDLYVGHRRTLHYPVFGPLAGCVALTGAALQPTALSVALAFGLITAGLHAASDVLGAGLELRPWEANSDRAVYDHFRGRWLEPRRVIRYDGAPEDVLLAGLLAAGPLVAFSAPVDTLVIALLAVTVVYGLLRKQFAALAGWVFSWLPPTVQPHVPDRYLDAGPEDSDQLAARNQ